MIREAERTDTDAIVFIHQLSFQGFFLSFLGEDFLKVLYSNLIDMSDSIKFVKIVDNKIIGFVVGTISQSSAYKNLLKSHWPSFVKSSMGAIIRKPTILPRLFRAIRMPREANRAASECLLMSIAIHPQFQGHSFGSQLLQAFLLEAEFRGSSAVTLTTDADQNEIVNRFYHRKGFRVTRKFTTPEGRRMNEYTYEIIEKS